MNLIGLAKGTSIKERYRILKQYYQEKQVQYDNYDLCNLKAWRKRPTLVTEERFSAILDNLDMTAADFDFAIKELDEAELTYIFTAIQETDWVQMTNQIFATDDRDQTYVYQDEYSNFTYALRFHVNYLEDRLDNILAEYPEVSFTDEAKAEYLGEVINRFMDIGLRTFVYDLHEKKESITFESTDEKERFREYLIDRFDSKVKVEQFLNQYPVLARLFADTVKFQIDNFRELVEALTESGSELVEMFSISVPIKITGLQMGAGDSHDKGKTVAVLEFNHEKKLVFKPKNLKIGLQFDRFVTQIQKLNDRFDFYVVKKLTKESYTFEEKIAHAECKNLQEVEQYYRRFGHIIGLVYILSGNDFHLENVLACGAYPVLIDLETIIQNQFAVPDNHNAIMKVIEKNVESVIMSGLVPVYLFEERAEEGIDGASRGVQLSALSGDQQKLPYKILKLVNYDSEHMQFVYEEHITEGSENIPLFNGEKIDFSQYIPDIMQGFTDFTTFAYEQREQLVILLKELFADQLVRNVIKTTQSYGDLLEYSTHPSCTVDYKEREKLFENLWMHTYPNAGPVPYEVRDMLRHDVPIFFNQTNSQGLLASEGEFIPDMYEEPSVERAMKRVGNFSLREQAEQLDYLRTSFGLYQPEELVTIHTSKLNQPATDLTGAALNVGEYILSEAFIGQNSIAWKNLEESADQHFLIEAVNENLYDGITGIYLFLSELYDITGDQRFKQPTESAENLIIELQNEFIPSISAFYGSLAAVYPLLTRYVRIKEERLLTVAEAIMQAYMRQYSVEAIETYDWTGGTASIIQLFMDMHQVTNDDVYSLFAIKLVEDFDINQIHQGGFAHGYAGVIYAANSVFQATGNETSKRLIEQCLQKERATFDDEQQGWLDYRANPPMVNDLWCYGSLGIGLTRFVLQENDFPDSQISEEIRIAVDRIIRHNKIDDCLCHGFFGDLEFLMQAEKMRLLTDEQRQLVGERKMATRAKANKGVYHLEGLPTVPKFGLFTGLAGVGHQLLRVDNDTVTANVLSLQLPNC